MLEHQKLVLKNVSNNPELFQKELNKSLAWLDSYEVFKLHKWVRDNYWTTHKDIIRDSFSMIAK